MILEFEGPARIGQEIADAVELELELEEGMFLVPRRKVESQLRRGPARLSPASIGEACRKAGVDLLVSGTWTDQADGPLLEVKGYNREGGVVFSEPLTLTSDDPDVEMLAGMIASSVTEAVATGLTAAAPEQSTRRPAVPDGPDDFEDPSWGDDLPDGDAAGERRSGGDADRAADSARREERPVEREQPRRRLLLDGDGEQEPEPPRESIADIDEEQEGAPKESLRKEIPYVEVSVAFEPLYWAYYVEAPEVGSSEVQWSPLSPFIGGSLRVEAWPIIYAGLDAQARSGLVEIDLQKIPGLNQRAIEVIFYELQLHARGRYVFDRGLPGMAVGGRLGYRFLMANAAPQDPFTVVPGYTAHILSPGLDVRLPFHKQYAVLDLSVEGIPFALYQEFPDHPGQPDTAATLGWRADLRFHSTIVYGIFAELRLFYEDYYVTYTGAGDRTNREGQVFHDGAVTTGLRGVSLGVGWSY